MSHLFPRAVYKDAHPTTAVLIVEVAEASLTYDRTEKASLYAKAGIQDYWGLNLINRRLEVRRTPIVDSTQPFGFGYASVTILTETEFVAPLALAQAKIASADLLP
jgi:Uma2 family endonuclease